MSNVVDAANLTGVPAVGEVLAGKFLVERVLGAGAMGVVLAARHTLLGRTVAIKLLAPSRDANENTVARFTREARAIAELASDHIVQLLDFGILDDGRPFMVMQYVAGRDLSTVVREGGPMAETEAVDCVIQACAGLAVAHAAGIVHRDIKPGNMMLTRKANGEPLLVILDFGIAKQHSLLEAEDASLTESQTTLGSPQYMSPEQIRDPKSVDGRSDVWSLGMVLRFLLSGKTAFGGREPSAVLAAIIADEPTPLVADAPSVAPGLAAVVARCLEKRPAFRFATVLDLARALAPFASAEGRALVAKLAPAKEAVAAAATMDGTFETLNAPKPAASKGSTKRPLLVVLSLVIVVGVAFAVSRRDSGARVDAPTSPSSTTAPPATAVTTVTSAASSTTAVVPQAPSASTSSVATSIPAPAHAPGHGHPAASVPPAPVVSAAPSAPVRDPLDSPK